MINLNRSLPPTRESVVAIARGQLGESDASVYWREVMSNSLPPWHGGYPKDWCGAFALACLRWANLCDWFWAVKGINDPAHWGFLHRLKRTMDPQPGDIGYQDEPYQHHFVVTELGELTFSSVDGNQGHPGVQERHRNKDPHKYAFYSIEQLLPEIAK